MLSTDQIRAAMRSFIPQPTDPALQQYYQMMEYHLGWRDEQLEPAQADAGKLIRPALALLACSALGGSEAQALPLAAAIQILHDFTLIHDDIEDHSLQRRGRSTLWTIWGMELGINAGDGMFALAHCALLGIADQGVDAARALQVIREFEATILRICEGQHLDLTGEGRFDTDEERYLRMIRGKTATLLAAAAGLGARIATDEPEQIAAMSIFGEALGMAFQMEDDLLDIWGDPRLTGKPFAADLLQRKMSLPVIHAYSHAGSERATIERVYRQEQVSAADVQTLLGLLERAGSRAYVAGLARAEHERALGALARIQPADATAFESLKQLATSLLNRVR
jgi:geranylgeranyl diphosphate synthase type I